MNNEKILIEIVWLGIDKSYDCIVPRQITVKALRENFLGIMEDMIGIKTGDSAGMMLMSARTRAVLSPENTLDESGVDSGDTIYII